MTLSEAIAQNKAKFISLTGSGGKTTLMQKLAAYYKSTGKSVLMTTTTKIQSPLFYRWDADFVYTSEQEVLLHEVKERQVVLFANKCLDVKKLEAPRAEIIDVLANRFDIIICEADGSRQLPLKIHSDRDPVISPLSDFTVATMGIWAIGEIARTQTMGSDSDQRVDSTFLNQLVENPQGLLKGTTAGKRLVLINGTEKEDPRLEELLKVDWPKGCPVIAGSAMHDSVERFIR